MNLFVLRHGIAVDLGVKGCARDSERVLTGEGKRKVRKVAKAMKAMKLEFDLILSSPFVRASETAEIVAKELGLDLAFTDALIPRTEVSKLAAVLAKHEDKAENVLIVGHEPHLSETIGYLLTGEDKSFVTLKKAGLCKLVLRSLKPAHGTLEWLLTPRQLSALR